MADVVKMPIREPLRKLGMYRPRIDPFALTVNFQRPPTDEEFRMIDDFLDMMVNQSGVMENRGDKKEAEDG